MNAPFSPLAASAALYGRMKGELAERYQLAEDDPALLDTLDGCTELGDGIAAILRRARELEAHVKSLQQQKRDLHDREVVKTEGAKKLRAIALHYMDQVGMRRLERPDFTASPANGRTKLIGLDAEGLADRLPERLCRIKREPDAKAIREAIEAGDVIEGVSLSNGGRTLRVS